MPRGKAVDIKGFVRSTVRYLERKSADAQTILLDQIQSELGLGKRGKRAGAKRKVKAKRRAKATGNGKVTASPKKKKAAKATTRRAPEPSASTEMSEE
jgi:hypothetical protein